MSNLSLIDSLRAIARGDSSAFGPTAQTLYEALVKGDSPFLNETLSQAALAENSSILMALDGLLDMFCTEPRTQTYGLERQWRTYAMTVLLRHPTGLSVSCLTDVEPLEKELATQLNINPSRLKCDPLVLPTSVVYDYGPVEAFQQCMASKVWAEGLISADPRKTARNTDFGLSKSQQITEAILLFNIHCTVDEGPEIIEKLEELSSDNLSVSLPVSLNNGATVSIQTMVIEAGSAWTHFNEALHTAELYRTGGAVQSLSKSKNISLSNLLLVAAYVEEDEEEQHTLRVSITKRDTGELVGCLLFADLHEPEHFLLKTDALLSTLGVFSIQRLEPTFYDAELRRETDKLPRFFVPGMGWQEPSDIL